MLVKSQVKYIQSLSQKKFRETESVFVAEGPKIINELLAAPNVVVKQLFASDSWIQSNVTLLKGRGSDVVLPVDEKELERISFLSTPNEVLGLFERPSFDSTVQPGGKICLMLDTIQDPGNLGTILRCADWFGISEVICSEDCVDVFSPKVVQSTMGSITRVRVTYTDLGKFLEKNNKVPVYAAMLDGNNLYSMDKLKEGIILVGNESKGISRSLLNGNIQKITIPRKGNAESLNAAIATGIILSHLT